MWGCAGYGHHSPGQCVATSIATALPPYLISVGGKHSAMTDSYSESDPLIRPLADPLADPLIKPLADPLKRPSSLSDDERTSKDQVLWNHLNDPTGHDPKLVFAAHNFVQDIIEKAKAEAAKRIKSQHKKVLDLSCHEDILCP